MIPVIWRSPEGKRILYYVLHALKPFPFLPSARRVCIAKMATTQATGATRLEPLDEHHVFYDSFRQYCRDNNLDRAVAGDWVEASPTSYQRRERKRMLRRTDHSADDVIPRPEQIEAPDRRLKPVLVEEPDTVRTDGGVATVQASALTASETTTISATNAPRGVSGTIDSVEQLFI